MTLPWIWFLLLFKNKKPAGWIAPLERTVCRFLIGLVENLGDVLPDRLARFRRNFLGKLPVIRVLAEAETAEAAEKLCAKVAALVTHELG